MLGILTRLLNSHSALVPSFWPCEVRGITVPGPGSAIGLWEAMYSVARIAAGWSERMQYRGRVGCARLGVLPSRSLDQPSGSGGQCIPQPRIVLGI